MRNRSQARAVALALGLEDGEALLIQGPPGTGKSTTAAEIDVQLILRDPGVRILVCSHSNHGTDNMLMKVLPFLEDAAERIARIGFYERIAKEARPFYAAADADLGDRNIIFTTIDALVLQDIAGARVYDYVIVDEANRAGVLDSLLALARGKRMILVGDPMQLQPVMSEAEQQMVAASQQRNGAGRHGRHGGRTSHGRRGPAGRAATSSARACSPGSRSAASRQRRPCCSTSRTACIRRSASWSRASSISNRVRTGPAAPRRGTGVPAFPSPVTWVDTRSLRGNVESRAGGTSLFNVAEARLVTSITRHLASHAPPNLTIGVITAYAEQRDLLRRLMGPHDWPPDRQLEIDTVDAFEGREKDIIVLSLVRANRRRDIGFLAARAAPERGDLALAAAADHRRRHVDAARWLLRPPDRHVPGGRPDRAGAEADRPVPESRPPAAASARIAGAKVRPRKRRLPRPRRRRSRPEDGVRDRGCAWRRSAAGPGGVARAWFASSSAACLGAAARTAARRCTSSAERLSGRGLGRVLPHDGTSLEPTGGLDGV